LAAPALQCDGAMMMLRDKAGAFPRVGVFNTGVTQPICADTDLAVQGSQPTHGDGMSDGSQGDSVVRARRACARPAAVAGGD